MSLFEINAILRKDQNVFHKYKKYLWHINIITILKREKKKTKFNNILSKQNVKIKI